MLKYNAHKINGFADKMQFGNLAVLYYPDKTYKNALRLFRREIQITPGLKEAMTAAGYQENNRILTRKQVEIVENFLGEMD